MRTFINSTTLLIRSVLLMTLYILISQGAIAQSTTDSLFLAGSRPIIFSASSNQLRPEDEVWVANELIPELKSFGPQSIILGRSAASPEGSLEGNRKLSLGRRDAAIRFFQQRGFDTSRIHFDVVAEEYELLVEMMRQRHDPDYETVRLIVEAGGEDLVSIKAELQAVDGGKLWKRLNVEYFPQLRAVRIMAFDPLPSFAINGLYSEMDDLRNGVARVPADQIRLGRVFEWTPAPESLCRRELLSVKTNLLELVAYVPQYGFCPMPNITVEYYPKHGHWTYGASFDFPWWVGSTSNHKYFELNNLQFEARYYLRNSDLSYTDDNLTQPAEGEAAFRGWYMQGYAHAFLYQIGFTAKKGWIGEGLGAGLGLGYVKPLSKDGHWRLDFGLQVGYFRTQYDPFVYGKPVYHGGEIDGQYYYNTDLYRDEFTKRQHRYSYLGPTRVGITLSYDLLYRRKSGKRPSFKKWEEGGEP